MIKLAYEKAVDNTGKLSFPYINKILLSWHENSINSVEKAQQSEKIRKQQEAPIESTINPKDFEDLSTYTVPDLSKKRG